jgi:hypothetical protein
MPPLWEGGRRGIWFANWSIHSVRQRPINVPVDDYEGYDAGPFVWSFAPSHDANMVTLEKPCGTHYAIFVLETREDVLNVLEFAKAPVPVQR